MRGMPVVTGRGEDLPFAGESFDLIVSLWVLEHLRVPEIVFGEVQRVLRPGGHFVFLTPNLRNPLLAFNGLMFRASVISDGLLPSSWGIHLLGDLTRPKSS